MHVSIGEGGRTLRTLLWLHVMVPDPKMLLNRLVVVAAEGLQTSTACGHNVIRDSIQDAQRQCASSSDNLTCCLFLLESFTLGEPYPGATLQHNENDELELSH